VTLFGWEDHLAESNGLKSPVACTPGSALGPTLGNKYGKTLPFLSIDDICEIHQQQALSGKLM